VGNQGGCFFCVDPRTVCEAIQSIFTVSVGLLGEMGRADGAKASDRLRDVLIGREGWPHSSVFHSPSQAAKGKGLGAVEEPVVIPSLEVLQACGPFSVRLLVPGMTSDGCLLDQIGVLSAFHGQGFSRAVDGHGMCLPGLVGRTGIKLHELMKLFGLPWMMHA
jgi:hypothetical protein